MCQVTKVFLIFVLKIWKSIVKSDQIWQNVRIGNIKKSMTNSRRGFYLCYWIIGVIFDSSQKFLDKWMSGIDFHSFLLVEVVITLHIMGFWMSLTSNNSLHISSPSKSGKMNAFDSNLKVWFLFSKLWGLPDGLFCHFLQMHYTNLAFLKWF